MTMANRVCDLSPCENLRAALEQFVFQNNESLCLVVDSNNMKGLRWLVGLHYCPWCGTRIEPDFVLDLNKAPRQLLRS